MSVIQYLHDDLRFIVYRYLHQACTNDIINQYHQLFTHYWDDCDSRHYFAYYDFYDDTVVRAMYRIFQNGMLQYKYEYIYRIRGPGAPKSYVAPLPKNY